MRRRRAHLINEFIPKYQVPGYRTLRPREEVEEGDLRWSRAKKCYVPPTKTRIGEMAGTTYTFIRREEKMPKPVELPEGYRYLKSIEKIKRGDLFWAIWSREYMRVTLDLFGKKAGTISTVIRKVKQ